ncbi:hypothetical protein [Haloprofundus halobius]|uniref:hypothetical protein n=1 Tax=Haloprofundus halobius TaxID=2876194 RepID=UPI001CC9E281|nr:hypothetical protein [Haloprofundus halobius]
MRTPALGRTATRTRRLLRRVTSPVRETVRLGANWAGARLSPERTAHPWKRVWLTRTDVRWRNADTVVECFRVADGYVATVEYTDRDVTWQLTKGPVPLASALAVSALYLQYELTPHVDADGRMFIAVAKEHPVEAFRNFEAKPFEYTYLDGYRSLEELPSWIGRVDIESVYTRLSSRSSHELPPG